MAEMLLQAALDYHALGWSIIPLRPRNKRPLVPWVEFQYRKARQVELESWFRHWPEANIGIVTGRLSGLVVLDVDLRHGGEKSMALLEREHGTLPPTVQAMTGGGGRHIYFAHPGRMIHNMTALASGVDLRGDGGYVVAPPSVHPTGGRYRWVEGAEPARRPLAQLPAWVLLLATSGEHQSGRTPDYWRDLVRTGVAEGERNTRIASLAGHLLWHRVDVQVVLELLLSWNRMRCRPPLGDDEVARTVASIARLHDQAG